MSRYLRLVPAILSAVVFIGCGGVESEQGEAHWQPTADQYSAEEYASTTTSCKGPPAPGLNPLSGYAWTSPTANVVVTSTADSGPGSLRQALLDVVNGGVISFSSSLTSATISLRTTLAIDKSVTLDASKAPGLTLDGGALVRIISIAKAKQTTFVGLRFFRGYTTGAGGAINVGQTDVGMPDGSVTIIGCKFEKNVGGRGGAINVGWRTRALIRDSVFVENDGSIGSESIRGFSGGAISTSQAASIKIVRSRFDRNRGWNGGAVYNILQPIEIEDSVFIGNESISEEGGGAVFVDGGNPAGPSNDPATGVDGLMAFRRVWIEGSRAKGYGGALLLWGYPRDVITIEDSVLKDNACNATSTARAKGGAVRLHGLASMRLINTAVVGNVSYQQGGGLWIDGSGPLEITNVTFSGNRVETDAGGGFMFAGTGKVVVRNSAFVDNYAGRAAGAFFYGNTLVDFTVSNTIFANNIGVKDIEQRHVALKPKDGGGNLEWVTSSPTRGRVFTNSTFADPNLGVLTTVNGMLVRPLLLGSPAINTGVLSAPTIDARRAARDSKPDIGPFEYGAQCIAP